MNAFHYTPRGSQPNNNPLQHKCCYKTTLFDNRGSRTVTIRRRACSCERWSWLRKNERSLIICLELVLWTCLLTYKGDEAMDTNTGSHFPGWKLRKPMEMQQCCRALHWCGCRAWQVEQDSWSGGVQLLVAPHISGWLLLCSAFTQCQDWSTRDGF